MSAPDPGCYPVFLKLANRRVLVVGAGPVAASKLEGLLSAGARITVVAPEMVPPVEALVSPDSPVADRVTLVRREFVTSDLDDVFYVVAAATPDVNRAVADACEIKHLFVNAVDDPPNASANLGGIVRRDGVTLAISTDGKAPAIAGLLREGLDALLPSDLDRWMEVAHDERAKWKATGVPMELRRPQLLQALNDLYAQRERERERQQAHEPGDAAAIESLTFAAASPSEPQRTGFVSLVGAGPGDPNLLTQLAARRLAEADLVLYDALVSPDVLPLAAHAQKLSVGKRACKPSISQDAINRVLVRAAKRGRRVVRLKCGDPFVFGRGGEEALALANAGVAFEVVPGVSSALAAPGLAGIPVTHRGITSSFTVMSGHSESAFGPIIDGMSPGTSTLVVLMGIGARAALAARLMARGWTAQTPAAILLSASTPDAQTWTGTLDALASREDGVDARPGETPGMLVIGDVVALAGQLGLARNLLNDYETESGEVAHGSGG